MVGAKARAAKVLELRNSLGSAKTKTKPTGVVNPRRKALATVLKVPPPPFYTEGKTEEEKVAYTIVARSRSGPEDQRAEDGAEPVGCGNPITSDM